ncbi:hypothetical protein [Aeromicrobium sp. Sec7.5]|uniref:hypothetical protein n=1 Tax=Aeromicrobium sp. Sec7.5 TaxID=3121276 RepID=UPI002FE45990
MSNDPSIPPPPGANTPPGQPLPGQPTPPPGQATPPPPGGYPPAGFPPQGNATPPGGGGGKKTGLIIGAIVLALLLIGGAITTVLLLTGGDDDDPDPKPTNTTSEDPDDEPTDDPDDDEVDLDDGPWVDTVEDFTTSYYDGDCATLLELAPDNWPDEAACLAEIMPGTFELLDYDIETTDLDDEQDPTEATVDIDYTIEQISTGQTQSYVTTFTIEDVDGDWVVTNFQTD